MTWHALNVSSFLPIQAVSGAGKEGIDELTDQTKAYSEGREMEAHILPSASLPKHYPIAFNFDSAD